jgi:F420-non-reducing hydrogenase iron-sulfur subunit
MSGHAGAATTPAANGFEPVILGFTCNWCSYRAADLAGTARMKYPPNVRLVRLMCSGRLDPAFVLKAFAEGADGVIVSGCWPGECHYQVQNLKALRRFVLLRRVVAGLGIEPARLQLVWASAAEGQRLATEIARVTEEVRALGPLRWTRDGPAGAETVDDVPAVAPEPRAEQAALLAAPEPELAQVAR